MSTRDFSSLQREWKLAALDSDLSLSWLVEDVRELLGATAQEEAIREVTLGALAPLLRSGELRAVDLLPGGGFRRWSGNIEEQLHRIEMEWRALGYDVRPGDIVWLIGPRDEEG